MAHRPLAIGLGLQRVEPFGHGARAREDRLVGLLQALDLLAREATTLEPDHVEAAQAGAVAHHQTVGDDVVLDPGHAADHGMAADAHELVHRR